MSISSTRFSAVLAVSAMLILGLAVFACGGGDDTGASLADIVYEASQNEPRHGSVTQGSNNVNGVTSDVITWDNDNQTVSNGSATASSSSTSTELVSGVTAPSSLSHFASSDSAFVAQVATGATVAGLYATKTGGSMSSFGAFADGGTEDSTPSGSVPADGSYSGSLIAFFHDSTSGDTYSSYSQATVSLTVSGNNITGTITAVADQDDDSPNSFSAISPAITVNLTATKDSTNPGFFSGNTSETTGSVAGKWGGEFFGTSGGSIGGTVGMSSGNMTIIGSFQATRSN